MPQSYVIDTSVLQKANASLETEPRAVSLFRKRLDLLRTVVEHKVEVLFSRRLIDEYKQQVAEPRNDFIKAFFALIEAPGRVSFNWPQWSGQRRSDARFCRFPQEDDHVLRTAIRPRRRGGYDPSVIIADGEDRMLNTDRCIHRRFRVHVWDLATTSW